MEVSDCWEWLSLQIIFILCFALVTLLSLGICLQQTDTVGHYKWSPIFSGSFLCVCDSSWHMPHTTQLGPSQRRGHEDLRFLSLEACLVLVFSSFAYNHKHAYAYWIQTMSWHKALSRWLSNIILSECPAWSPPPPQLSASSCIIVCNWWLHFTCSPLCLTWLRSSSQ